MNIPFFKMHGLGNDFVVIDERRGGHGLTAEQLMYLADRRLGVGCDQILFLDRARNEAANARYRVANADGSPAEHCGNGIRCVARLLQRLGEARESVLIEVAEDVFELSFVAGENVRVEMAPPRFAPPDIPLAVAKEDDRYHTEIGQQSIEFGAVSVGNPHAVLEVRSVEEAPVAEIGPALQSSTLFPASVNVGFMQILDPGHISLRVYERGVGETQACGTGACAAMAIGRRWQRLEEKVLVGLRGGTLEIEWDGDPRHVQWMTGPATFVYEGKIEL